MRTDEPLERRLRTVCEGSDARTPRDVVGASARAAITAWTRPAVRSMAVLLCLALVVAGYWAWSGRPREVAVAPAVLSTGAPVGGAPASAAPLSASSVAGFPDPSSALDRVPVSPTTTAPTAPTVPTTMPTMPAVPTVVVHVTGLVRTPGVVELPQGSRVADAIDEAGGVTKPRASSSVNLARVLVDGEQVVVGLPNSPTAPVPAPATSGSRSGTPMMLNLNAADAAALETLPGIGPVIAERIVAWRTANGPFRSVDELGEVSGIGDAILSQVRSSVWV